MSIPKLNLPTIKPLISIILKKHIPFLLVEDRSKRSQVFHKIDVCKTFSKFTGKNMWRSQTSSQQFFKKVTLAQEHVFYRALPANCFSKRFSLVWLLKCCQSRNFCYVLYSCYMKFYFCYIFHVYVIYFVIYLLYIYIYIIRFLTLLYVIFTLSDFQFEW